MNNAAKNVDSLAINLNYIIILMVQTKLFLDLYLAKFLDSKTVLFVYKFEKCRSPTPTLYFLYLYTLIGRQDCTCVCASAWDWYLTAIFFRRVKLWDSVLNKSKEYDRRDNSLIVIRTII